MAQLLKGQAKAIVVYLLTFWIQRPCQNAAVDYGRWVTVGCELGVVVLAATVVLSKEVTLTLTLLRVLKLTIIY